MNPETTGAYLRTLACILWGAFLGWSGAPADRVILAFVAIAATGASIIWAGIWSKSE